MEKVRVEIEIDDEEILEVEVDERYEAGLKRVVGLVYLYVTNLFFRNRFINQTLKESIFVVMFQEEKTKERFSLLFVFVVPLPFQSS